MDQERLTKARENFDSLSAKDKALILADLNNVPVPVPAPAPAVPSGDFVSMISAVVEALDIPKMVKRCSKVSRDSDPDSEDYEVNKFARLTFFGSQELRKET